MQSSLASGAPNPRRCGAGWLVRCGRRRVRREGLAADPCYLDLDALDALDLDALRYLLFELADPLLQHLDADHQVVEDLGLRLVAQIRPRLLNVQLPHDRNPFLPRASIPARLPVGSHRRRRGWQPRTARDCPRGADIP